MAWHERDTHAPSKLNTIAQVDAAVANDAFSVTVSAPVAAAAPVVTAIAPGDVATAAQGAPALEPASAEATPADDSEKTCNDAAAATGANSSSRPAERGAAAGWGRWEGGARESSRRVLSLC